MKYIRIDEITSVITGGTPSTNKNEYWDNGDIPWLQSGCCQNCDVVNANKHITKMGYDNSSTRLMPKDTVMIALTGATAGKVGYLTFEACGNQSITGILPSDKLNQRYLFFYLVSQREKILSDCVGGAQPHISQGYVKNIQVPLRSLEEQKRIADVLSSLSDAIKVGQKKLSLFDELVKARFVEMFGDLATNDKKWPMKNFLEFAQFDCQMTTDYEKYADYPHIGIDAIEKNTGKILSYRTVKEDGVISGKYLFSPEHIIYSKIRPNLNKVATPDFYGVCSADAYPILPRENITKKEFLAAILRSDYYLDYVSHLSTRANMPKVNRTQISGFVCPIPPIALQEEYKTLVDDIDKSKFVESLHLAKRKNRQYNRIGFLEVNTWDM